LIPPANMVARVTERIIAAANDPEDQEVRPTSRFTVARIGARCRSVSNPTPCFIPGCGLPRMRLPRRRATMGDGSVMYGKPVALQCEISRRGSRGALLLGGPNLESSTGSYFYPLPNIL
jgi:hypothetical protein